MNAEKPNIPSFLSQPVVKNIFVFRNGDPYFEARRLVINEKRVSNFETLLREVTGGVQAQFGAVRNIYTPKGGHRVDSLEHLHNGEQYVAAGREKFKKLDYLQIGNRKKRVLQTNGMVKPVPQSRFTVAARFLKPIKDPCAIFILANGDVLNPAMRFLVPNRVQDQFERILEMITEKMGLRVLGGVRGLYTFDGIPITDGKELENGQFYVAVGRDRFKRLPYAELLFTRPMGVRRVIRTKAASLPPIYGFRRQNGNGARLSKSTVTAACGEVADAPPAEGGKPDVASLVREISQARLMTLRKKRGGLSMSLATQDIDDQKPEAEDEEGEPAHPEEEPSAEEQEKTVEEEEAEPDEEAATQDTEEVEPAGEEVEEEKAEEEGPGEHGEEEEEEEETGEDAEDNDAAEGDGEAAG